MQKLLLHRSKSGIWDVQVRVNRPGIMQVAARGSSLTIVVGPHVAGGRLVSVPEHNRCGGVPVDVQGRDVMAYCDFPNQVDAESAATALRWYFSEYEPSAAGIPADSRV